MAPPKRFNCSPDIRIRRVAFGASVRARRQQLGLTQQQLAERADVARQTIVRTESGYYSPHLDLCWLLADALELPLSEIMALALPAVTS